MEPYMIAVIAVAAVAVIFFIGIAVSHNARKNLRSRLMGSYGKISKREYTYEEYQCIAHYFRNTTGKDEFCIDNTTWNDVDMDRIFMLVDNTNSSVGRDYLYKLLRTPVSDKDTLKKRDAVIEYMDSHAKERTSIMELFCDIGFTKKISISDYMENLFRLKPESNAFHYIMLICIIASIVYAFTINAAVGVGLIILSCGVSIVSYYRTKSRIDSYFECIRQLTAMTGAADSISKMNISELSECNIRLQNAVKRFGKVTRGAFVIVGGRGNSGSIADIVLEYIRMFTHIDLIKFNSMLRHIDKNIDVVYELMDTLGFIEAMISIASFRRVIPYFCKPEFTGGQSLELTDVYHLMIKTPVANSIIEDRPVLITGSNASGKSTFLKSVAICAILAQTVYTCPAKSYSAPFYRIYSSMALADDIAAGESYYIVEIKSLKRIVDAAKVSGNRVLCFIDEVLRGTNTVERIAASSEILKSLSDSGVMCFAATHDVELTHILERYYANYHFTEEVRDDKVVFSYKLHKGRATSRNAIKLLGIIGYDDSIINNSRQRADDFMNTGVWRQC